MVFILSPGADPQGDIQLLCEERGMMSKFRFIALGQGQGPKAEHLIDQGTKSGHWVLLQNCHLLVSWLKMLEKKMELMKAPCVAPRPVSRRRRDSSRGEEALGGFFVEFEPFLTASVHTGAARVGREETK